MKDEQENDEWEDEPWMADAEDENSTALDEEVEDDEITAAEEGFVRGYRHERSYA